MTRGAAVRLRSFLGAWRTRASRAVDGLRRGRLYRPDPVGTDLDRHLGEGVDWLVRAQDAGTDRGVAYGVHFGGPFLSSYPETTGYIIPTFLKLADHYEDPSLERRAFEMGVWESQIQLESGAVMGGPVGVTPSPAVFNTGMVLFGWSALYVRSGDPSFLDSLRRATDWLLKVQRPEGDWREGNSEFANPDTTVYNVYAALGLCEAGRVANIPAAIEGAVRNAEFCLSKQLPNGWYRDCCLDHATEPLLHTIGYAMQGLIGIGVTAKRHDFVAAAARTADSLIASMDGDGFIPGRLDSDFAGTVSWSCLTGTAQTAIVWGQLYQLTGRPAYLEAMQRANRYLMRRHDVDNPDLRLRGGVPGSWPVSGDYCRLMILNWATNFLVEALLLERSISGPTDLGVTPRAARGRTRSCAAALRRE